MLTPPLRLGELVATPALAQDNAFGQPLESQLRSCLLATWMREAAGFDKEVRGDAYWVAQLRYVGCTGHARDVATVEKATSDRAGFGAGAGQPPPSSG